MSARCYYFGCWNEAGHYLFAPDGRRGPSELQHFGNYVSLDGTLAPRRMRRDRNQRIAAGALCWDAQGRHRDERRDLDYDSEEYPQGQFLLHFLDTGYTAIQWWDRNQGDERGACNSTILLEGRHTAAEMVAALREHFPHVAANLDRAGVKLVEVAVPPVMAGKE